MLSPVQTPFDSNFMHLSSGTVFLIVFFLILIIWLIYTLVAGYHWLKFGNQSKIGISVLIVHVVVSALLFLMAGSGFLLT